MLPYLHASLMFFGLLLGTLAVSTSAGVLPMPSAEAQATAVSFPSASNTSSVTGTTSNTSISQESIYTPVNPMRLADTRCSASPAPSYCASENLPSPNASLTSPAGGKSENVTVTGIDGIPSNATAVVINVTALNMTTSGYFSIYSEGATPAVVSSLNWTANSGVVTNLVTVPVNTSNGEIVIANGGTSGTVNYVVDIEGYYTPPSSTPAGLYNAVTPTRLADSRCSESPLPTGITSSYCSTIPSANGKLATLGPGETENVTVTGIGGIPFSGVSAVVLNLTAIGPTSSGYLTAFPTGATKAEVSTVNFNKGETTPSRVIVKVGSNGQISIYNFSGNTNFAVDVSGYYTDGSSSSQTGSLFNPVTPARILDTRCSQSSLPVGITSSYCASLPSANATLPAIAGGKSIAVQVTGIDSIPSSATAVVGNLTATDGNGGGYLTIYGATTAPTTSDVNFATGTTNANMVISGLNSSGQVNIENGGESGSVNVLIDLAGYFIPAPPPAPAPTITSISPTSGPTAGGTSVTITGTNFTSSATVDFGSTAATSVTYNSATSLTATSPAESAGTVDVTVTTVGDTSATSSADQFTYTPYITNISPTTASMLSDVTLTGDGFGSSPGYVKLADLTTGTGWGAPGDGAYFYIVSWSNTQVVFQVPSDSGWWDNASWIPYSGDSMAVTIVSSGNTSNTVNFTIGSPNLYSYTSQSTATEYLGPGNNFTQEGSIASNTTVDLICQGTGQAVSDSSSPSGTSDIWDLTSAATWISDTTVNTTGVNEFTPPIPQCTGFITNPYPQNYTGYDISWPQCGSTSNYPPTPYTVNIVGVDSSPGSWNSCLSSEATWDTSSSSPLETYIVPASGTSSTVTGIDICGGNEYCRYGYETAQSAYQYATSILGSSTPSTWLLDVENYDIGSTPAWQSCSSTDTTACTDNIETIQGNLDFFIYNSMYVGLYSSPSEWSSITNDWSTLQGQFYVVGNWLAYYLQSSNNTAPSSCSTSVNSNYVPFSQGPLWLLQYGPTGGSSGDSWDGDISCYTN